jgi:HSP20 family molecular chaperone IbpA
MYHYKHKIRRAPVIGGPRRLRQLRQFDFGFQHDEEDKLRVVVPLPGISKDSLKVRVKNNILSISVSVKEEYHKYATRPDDSWDIYLLEEVVQDSALAKYKDGLLFIDFELKHTSKDVEIVE